MNSCILPIRNASRSSRRSYSSKVYQIKGWKTYLVELRVELPELAHGVEALAALEHGVELAPHALEGLLLLALGLQGRPGGAGVQVPGRGGTGELGLAVGEELDLRHLVEVRRPHYWRHSLAKLSFESLRILALCNCHHSGLLVHPLKRHQLIDLLGVQVARDELRLPLEPVLRPFTPPPLLPRRDLPRLDEEERVDVLLELPAHGGPVRRVGLPPEQLVLLVNDHLDEGLRPARLLPRLRPAHVKWSRRCHRCECLVVQRGFFAGGGLQSLCRRELAV